MRGLRPASTASSGRTPAGGGSAGRRRCVRPSRFVIVPSFSSAEVAGRMTWAQSAVGVGKSELATTDSQRCSAASQRSGSGKRESGSASPSTIEHLQRAVLGAAQHRRPASSR